MDGVDKLPCLGCDANWAGVGVALAHHDTANGDEGRSGKPKLLSSQQGSYCGVESCPHLAICLKNGPATEIIRHQHLHGKKVK